MSSFAIFGLCFASAVFYAGAQFVMKLGSGLPFLVVLVPVLLTLSVAAGIESIALSGARIGHVVILIIGFETLCTAVFALLVLGESYRLTEVAGFAAILIGAGLLARF
jgi:hypothetical protein